MQSLCFSSAAASLVVAFVACSSSEPSTEAPRQSAVASGSAVARTADTPAPLEPGDIDIARATELPEVWKVPSQGGEPVLVAGGVVVVDPGGRSVSSVAPDTGRPLWQVAAPAGVAFSRLMRGDRDEALFVGGYLSAGGGALTRVDPKAGKILWTVNGPDEVKLGHDGTGGVVGGGKCSSRVIDLSTGKISSGSISDSMVEIFGRDGSPPSSRCKPATTPLAERGGVTLVSSDRQSERKMIGLDSDGSTKYEIAIGNAWPRVAFTYRDDVVLLLLGEETEIARVRVATGRIRFRKTLSLPNGCAEDDNGYYAAVVHDGIDRKLFVRACGRALLVDMGTGAVDWVEEIGGDAAFLSGVDNIPWEQPASMVVSTIKPLGVRMMDDHGNVKKTIALPGGTREVMPVAGGVFVTTEGLDANAFYDERGLRWRLPLRFGNSFLQGERVVVLGSKIAAQVVVEPGTGAAFIVRGCGSVPCASGSPYSIGDVGGLWITTRNDPDELFAVRLPKP